MSKIVKLIDGCKTCGACNQLLSLESFCIDKKGPHGRFSWCRECVSKNNKNPEKGTKRKNKAKVYYENNKKEINRKKKERDNNIAQLIGCSVRRKHHLKQKFGITFEDYMRMVEKQDNKCAICNNPEERYSKVLGVDHCHKTNKIRALLCNSCNIGIGSFKDNINLMEKAIEYIRKYTQ